MERFRAFVVERFGTYRTGLGPRSAGPRNGVLTIPLVFDRLKEVSLMPLSPRDSVP